MVPFERSSTPTSAVASRCSAPRRQNWSSRSSALPGDRSSRTSNSRVWRWRLMTLAAPTSWPCTSPTTSPTSESVMGTTSYQPPPTSTPTAAGRSRAVTSQP